jgi:hypothetical protein
VKRSAPLKRETGLKRSGFKRGPQHQRQGKTRSCVVCGAEFYAPPSHPKKFCSRGCYVKDMAERRKGDGNPNFKHGGRIGKKLPARFKSGQTACQHPECDGTARRLHEHHVVYQQHVVREGGDVADPRNALRLCERCHSRHHRRGAVLPLAALRKENIAYALELLDERTLDYFQRYYVVPDGLTLEELRLVIPKER